MIVLPFSFGLKYARDSETYNKLHPHPHSLAGLPGTKHSRPGSDFKKWDASFDG
jgi:hypothetical protein